MMSHRGIFTFRGLRSKILVGLGGLLLLLIVVSVLGEIMLNRYSGAMKQSFKEDYQSAKYCEDLAHAVDKIDTALQLHFWQGGPLSGEEIRQSSDQCDAQIEAQRAIATLPGEREVTDRLFRDWNDYKRIYPRLLNTAFA